MTEKKSKQKVMSEMIDWDQQLAIAVAEVSSHEADIPRFQASLALAQGNAEAARTIVEALSSTEDIKGHFEEQLTEMVEERHAVINPGAERGMISWPWEGEAGGIDFKGTLAIFGITKGPVASCLMLYPIDREGRQIWVPGISQHYAAPKTTKRGNLIAACLGTEAQRFGLLMRVGEVCAAADVVESIAGADPDEVDNPEVAPYVSSAALRSLVRCECGVYRMQAIYPECTNHCGPDWAQSFKGVFDASLDSPGPTVEHKAPSCHACGGTIADALVIRTSPGSQSACRYLHQKCASSAPGACFTCGSSSKPAASRCRFRPDTPICKPCHASSCVSCAGCSKDIVGQSLLLVSTGVRVCNERCALLFLGAEEIL